MNCEIIISADMIDSGKAILKAMAKAAPIPTVVNNFYAGSYDLMMTYGVGHAIRGAWFKEHVASGRHAIGWDQCYWDRKGSLDRTMRLTVDADHPQLWMDDRPSDRFNASAIELRDDYDPFGPVVLVGMGPKSDVRYSQPRLTWERSALARIRSAHPGKRIIHRPKRRTDPLLTGTVRMAGMPIEQVLRGASLVVCRHSNVAVDACIAGIPVCCECGAAALIYGNDLANPRRPGREQRLKFLSSLAYWQWKPSEAKQAWAFLLSRIEEREAVSLA